MLTFIRSSLFTLFSVAALIALSPILLLGPLFPFEKRYRYLFSFGRAIVWNARVFIGIRHEIHGLEHLAASGGNLIASKHQSAWETMFLPTLLHLPAFVLKRELLWIPIFGAGLRGLSPIAINRRAGRKALSQILQQGEAALDSGRDVVIFPEGTRTRPVDPPNYRIGAAMLATHSGRPVIPVAIDSGCLWPRDRFLKRPGVVHVVFGPPIESAGKRADALNEEIQQWIETEQERLYAQYGCPSAGTHPEHSRPHSG